MTRLPSPSLPPALSDVALVTAKTAAAVGAMSLSWWYEEVAAGRAPQPVIRGPRCTRWLLADVRAFWARRAGTTDAGTAAQASASSLATEATQA